jgi:hypothetical protein
MLTSPAVPTTGTYYVNASVTAIVANGDEVACGIDGAAGGLFPVGPVASPGNNFSSYETLPVTGAVSLNSGQKINVVCEEYSGYAGTEFVRGALTAILVANSTG